MAIIVASMDTIILDNGGYSLKVGGSLSDSPKVLPNCITRFVRSKIYDQS